MTTDAQIAALGRNMAADQACPLCRGRGYTSAPYTMGLRDGDLYTHTICACVTRRKEYEHDR